MKPTLLLVVSGSGKMVVEPKMIKPMIQEPMIANMDWKATKLKA